MDRKILIKNLRRFKKKVENKHEIKKMVLFGSRAKKDKVRNESDVDLIVVGKFKGKSNLERAPPLYLEWDLDLPVDFLCYTPEEFKRLSKIVSIVRESKKNGIIIR